MSESVVARMRLQNLGRLLEEVDRPGGLVRARKQLGLDRKLPRGEVRAEMEKRIAGIREELKR